MLDQYFSNSSAFSIAEYSLNYWTKKTGPQGIDGISYVFVKKRDVSGLFVERGEFATATGSIVPIMEIRSMVGDLFLPSANPLPALAGDVGKYTILRPDGTYGVACTTLPQAAGNIQKTATVVQNRIVVTDRLTDRRFVYALSSRSVKYNLDGDAIAFSYILLPQYGGNGTDKGNANIIDLALSDDGKLGMYCGKVMLAY